MIWVVLVAVAFVLGWNDVSSPPDTQASDPNPSSSFRIFALGDSYISGEGARSYFEGTDVPANMCHRAKTAYPHLIAEKLGASLTFVACSGAVTKDVTGFDAAGNPVPGQHPQSPSDVFGGRPQVKILREAADGEDAERPDAVLISIGGNDAGFAEIGIDCATPLFSDCRDLASHWLRRLETDVYPALVRTDAAVREDAGGAPVFARGAPIDIAHLGGLTHGSLHPNQLGHELIEPIVLRRIEAVQAGGFKRPPAPQADNGPPPLTPEELGSPGKPPEFPSGTDCHGTSLAAVTQMSTDPDRESVSLSGLGPNSTVCFRTYRAEWESKRADSTGKVEVPVDVSRAGVASINQILVEEPGGVWKQLVVSRLGSADVG